MIALLLLRPLAQMWKCADETRLFCGISDFLQDLEIQSNFDYFYSQVPTNSHFFSILL